MQDLKKFFLERKLQKTNKDLLKTQKCIDEIVANFEPREMVKNLDVDNKILEELATREMELKCEKADYTKHKLNFLYYGSFVVLIFGYHTGYFLFRYPDTDYSKISALAGAGLLAGIGGALVVKDFIKYHKDKKNYESMVKYVEGKHKTLNSKKQKIEELQTKHEIIKKKIEEIDNANAECSILSNK